MRQPAPVASLMNGRPMPEAKKPARSGKTAGFLHDHPNFLDLIRQVGQARGVNPYLV